MLRLFCFIRWTIRIRIPIFFWVSPLNICSVIDCGSIVSDPAYCVYSCFRDLRSGGLLALDEFELSMEVVLQYMGELT
jgi:hypothetical protein